MSLLRRLFVCCVCLAGLVAVTAPARADAFADGKAAYDSRRWDDAITLLRPLGESGDGRALMLIGNMYAEGYGVVQNDDEAFSLYLRAARLDQPDGMIAVGTVYLQGTGDAANPRVALAWYRRAAEMGSSLGALLYAGLLYEGRRDTSHPEHEIAPDHAEAYRWFMIAARSKNPKVAEPATTAAAALGQALDPALKAQIEADAARWTPKSAADAAPPPP